LLLDGYEAFRPLPAPVASVSVAVALIALEPGAAAGRASAGGAAVAAGNGLDGPAVVADTTTDLSMCFLCVFFNLPMVGQPPTSGRFFFKFFHMRFAQIIQKTEKKREKCKEITEIFLIRLYCIHAVNSRNKLHGVSVTTY
jgi:hypothetical protein